MQFMAWLYKHAAQSLGMNISFFPESIDVRMAFMFVNAMMASRSMFWMMC